jgi:hypothetical protein
MIASQVSLAAPLHNMNDSVRTTGTLLQEPVTKLCPLRYMPFTHCRWLRIKSCLYRTHKTVKQVMCSVATVLHILVAGCSNSTFDLWCLGCPLSSLFYCQEYKAFLFPQRATEDQNVFVSS